MICLDTSLLIDLLNQREKAVKKIKELRNEQVATTRINVFEVLLGSFYRSKTEWFRGDIKPLIESINILELNEIATIKAAEIAARLAKKGKEIGHSDALIAGIMLAHGCNKIITRNEDHFSRINGILVEGY